MASTNNSRSRVQLLVVVPMFVVPRRRRLSRYHAGTGPESGQKSFTSSENVLTPMRLKPIDIVTQAA